MKTRDRKLVVRTSDGTGEALDDTTEYIVSQGEVAIEQPFRQIVVATTNQLS